MFVLLFCFIDSNYSGSGKLYERQGNCLQNFSIDQGVFKNQKLSFQGVFLRTFLCHTSCFSVFFPEKVYLDILSHVLRLKDVRAHCYCASSQRTQIHMPRHASSARAKY